jgi:hypothetical protein
MRNPARFVSLAVLVGSALVLAACSSQPTANSDSMSDRQDQALKHPMEWTSGKDIPDISSGGIGDVDKSLGKELHDFFNP